MVDPAVRATSPRGASRDRIGHDPGFPAAGDLPDAVDLAAVLVATGGGPKDLGALIDSPTGRVEPTNGARR